jgi:hypothetical protein
MVMFILKKDPRCLLYSSQLAPDACLKVQLPRSFCRCFAAAARPPPARRRHAELE